MATQQKKKPASAATNLIAGGAAGMMEALACHPLDTIKVRMQLSKRKSENGKRRGFIRTGIDIAAKETPLGLYKGLGAVLTGIIPKMAIRFTSYEWYKQLLADKNGNVAGSSNFLAGLAAGVTEAVAVVTPMDVVKIRLQAQFHSMADPLDVPKYRNAAHATYTILREEGPGALWRGTTLTALRQGTNQAANFTAYAELKALAQRHSADPSAQLPSYDTMVIGLISGAVGPFCNAPIDTIKTRLQKMPAEPGQTTLQRISLISSQMFKQEGPRAFWMGITPRVARVAPGQAVTFAVYEYLKDILERSKPIVPRAKYEE